MKQKTRSHVRRNALIGAGVALSALLLGVGIAQATISGSLTPNGEGYSLQWTPSTGTTHYTLVNESSCNGTTNYVSTVTAGHRDAYTTDISTVPTGATITNIDIVPCASRTATGGTNPIMNVFYRWNGTNSADAGSYSLTGATPVALATTSFSGLTLTKNSSSTMEVGTVLTSGAKGARLSRITTVITYSVTLTSPNALSATAATTSLSINLAWTDNSSNEQGFKVERSLVSTSSFSVIGSTGTNTTAYLDSTVSSGVAYQYRVRAYNGTNFSLYSNTASATAPILPAAPSPVTATHNASTTLVDVTWGSVSGTNYYTIDRGFNSTTSFSFIGTTSAASLSNLATTTGTYYYRVKATTAIGTGAYGLSNGAIVP